MASDYGTYGWERCDGFVAALKATGTAHEITTAPGGLVYGGEWDEPKPLRLVTFQGAGGHMVAEEYLASTSLQDGSYLGLSVYLVGQRPQLHTRRHH